MLLLIDNYDSFTYNLKDYFEQLGQEVQVVMNDELSNIHFDSSLYSGIVVSPGPCTPPEAGQLMQHADKIFNQFKVLGICLGHQALGLWGGAKLVRGIRPVHGKTSPINHNSQGVYKNLPQTFKVCRYHSLVLKEIPEQFQITSTTEDNEVMGIAHNELPLTGIQFHPEAILSEYGIELLQNWINL